MPSTGLGLELHALQVHAQHTLCAGPCAVQWVMTNRASGCTSLNWNLNE